MKGKMKKTQREATKCLKEMTYRRGLAIDAQNDRKMKGPISREEGPKEQVLRIYLQESRDAAIQKAKELGYSEDICNSWIKDFEFKRQIQSVCREKGQGEALILFNKLNEEHFDGRYKKATFINWIKNITRDDGAR